MEVFPDGGGGYRSRRCVIDLVLSSVALALSVPEQRGRELEESLIDALSAGRSILLLDNLEHLLPSAAAKVATLRDAGVYRRRHE